MNQHRRATWYTYQINVTLKAATCWNHDTHDEAGLGDWCVMRESAEMGRGMIGGIYMTYAGWMERMDEGDDFMR